MLREGGSLEHRPANAVRNLHARNNNPVGTRSALIASACDHLTGLRPNYRTNKNTKQYRLPNTECRNVKDMLPSSPSAWDSSHAVCSLVNSMRPKVKLNVTKGRSVGLTLSVSTL